MTHLRQSNKFELCKIESFRNILVVTIDCTYDDKLLCYQYAAGIGQCSFFGKSSEGAFISPEEICTIFTECLLIFQKDLLNIWKNC